MRLRSESSSSIQEKKDPLCKNSFNAYCMNTEVKEIKVPGDLFTFGVDTKVRHSTTFYDLSTLLVNFFNKNVNTN